ncbi:MAG: LicD family protein [Lachnospiraceae bacterium]|nr:LicD family protein [Lachnospiraceae bacterium]
MGCYEQVLYEKISELIDRKLLVGKSIYLFGKNVPSYLAKGYLQKQGYAVSGIIDNNSMVVGMKIDGIEVKKPEEALGNFDENVVVLIASQYYYEMSKQLQEMGYKDNYNIFSIMNFSEARERTIKKYENKHILSVDELQDENLKMLKYIDKICKENKLAYYLCGGSLLGAVRHKGYIPWDDDIDISIPYPYYKKLLDIIQQDGVYTTARRRFGKIINTDIKAVELGFSDTIWENGLGIDVFPIYSLPDDDIECEAAINKNRELRDMIIYNYGHCVDNTEKEKIIEQIVELWENIGYSKTKRVMRTAVGAAGYAKEEHVSYEAYEKAIYMQFCDGLFPVPIGYDEILTVFYGDYMTLPPIEKRRSHHNRLFYY